MPLAAVKVPAAPAPEPLPASAEAVDSPSENVRQRAESLIRRLLHPAKLENAPLRIAPPRLVNPKPGQRWGTLPPVRTVRFNVSDLGSGYLFLSTSEEMALEEFAFDLTHPVHPLNGGWVEGVPNLQQFPIPSPGGKGQTASGCVPTAGASLIGFWAAHAFAGWLTAGRNGETQSVPPSEFKNSEDRENTALKKATLRLRKNMRMIEIDDKEGYTDHTLSLSGALTDDLARALQRDAEERKQPFQTRYADFSVETLHTEIENGRPMLVDCVVRLPHKPELTWGHEVVAVGWQQVEDFEYIGVVDNFFPVQNAATVRWIEKRAFGGGIVVKPDRKTSPSEPDKKTTP